MIRVPGVEPLGPLLSFLYYIRLRGHSYALNFSFLFCLHSLQVIIGSGDLTANHAICQNVEILSESQKYNKYVYITDLDNLVIFLCSFFNVRYPFPLTFLIAYRLVKLLEDIMDGSRILIFLDTKKGCDQITRQLRMDGWPALSIHGDKSQAERDWVLSEFKAGKSPIMTATDVAARGLGIHIFFYCNRFFFVS